MVRKKENFISATHPFLKLERKPDQSVLNRFMSFLNQKHMPVTSSLYTKPMQNPTTAFERVCSVISAYFD